MTDTMTSMLIEMTEDTFDSTYPLIINHLDPTAAWAHGEGSGCLFEAYGEQLDFVRRQDPRTVWTLVDGDAGDQHVVSGYHIVNRIGYLISTVPVPDGTAVQVHIPMDDLPSADGSN
jgi:hypothetical protein